VTAAVAIVVMGLLVFQWLDEPSATDAMALRKFSFTPPERLSQPEPWFASHVAVSPNGKHVAFIAGDRQTLWVRDLANEQVREIPGTENALFPFWSPDSEFIGFGTDKELKKISVEGAAAITLSELPGEWYFGGSWSPDGDSIVFASNSPEQFYEVLAGGGSPELFFDLEESEGGTQVLNPEFLPSEAAARSVVFAEGSRSGMEVVLKNLETGERLSLGTGAFPRYSSTGHIVYQTNYREGGLWALPFSIRTLQPTGEAFPIAQNAGFPSIADDGTLVYVDFGAGGGERQLVWMNREGGKLGTVGQPQASIRHTDLSPDETRVAVTAGDEEGHNEIWVHEVERGVKTRITFTSGGQAMSPHWSPSGSELLFSSAREGSQTLDIHVKSADGTGEAKLVFGSELNDYASDWSTDGRYALADQHSPTTQFPTHVLLLGRKDDGRFEGSPLFATEYVEKAAKLSPDGRYVAYVSDESGVFELYVQRFPDGGEKLQISVRGGRQPRWSRDGAELFFVEDDALMVVQVEHGERLSVSAPEMLFRSAAFGTSPHAHYDVSSDGRRFILAEYTDRNPTRIRVVQNWYEEFKDQERD
jgi:Tol biopolymer transport system component